jgi:hypothetical protein
MIISEKISEMITRELDQLIELNHKPYYKMAKIDIYTGRLLQKNDDQPEGETQVPTVARKVFVPDATTMDTCVRINKMLLYGREPHPASHGFERQRDLGSYIEPHISQRRLLTLQLQNAFERIGKKRIRTIANRLLGLDEVHATFFSELLTMRGRMAGGNPVSPQILNIQMYKTDRYLSEFSVKYKLDYTRFLDAFAFSSPHFIHTEVIARIKRIISRCGWMIDNEQVDIQSGNHFHLGGQVVTPDYVTERRAREQGAQARQDSQLNRGAFRSILRSANATQRVSREQNLIQSLKKKVNRGTDQV